MTATAEPRIRILEALRLRDFRLLWAGQTVSQIGDAAFVVALGWRAFTLTHKASSLGIVFMVDASALLVTLLIGGVLADRYSRRALMVGSDLARAAVVGGLTAVDATGHLGFGTLIAFVALQGLGSGLFQPAFGGIVPLLVDTAQLGSANALIGISRQVAFVIGPALAGGIYGAAGSSAIFGADAASFLVSAALLMRARPRAFEPAPSEGIRRELVAGIRYVAGVEWLWWTIATWSIVLMVGFSAIQVLLPKLVEDKWNGGVASYGVLYTMVGIGMVIGSVVLGQRAWPRRPLVEIYALFVLNSAAIIGLALSPWFSPAAAVCVVRGFCVGYGITLWDTLVMKRVPEHMLSRVISLDWFGAIGLLPAGLGLWALLSGLSTPGTLIATSAAVTGLVFAAGLANPRVRSGG